MPDSPDTLLRKAESAKKTLRITSIRIRVDGADSNSVMRSRFIARAFVHDALVDLLASSEGPQPSTTRLRLLRCSLFSYAPMNYFASSLLLQILREIPLNSI